MLVRRRRLQRLELAGQQPRWHEVTPAGGEPARDQRFGAVEEDDANVTASMDEDVAIGALERRAGDHGALASPAGAVNLVGNGLQPGPAVLVGEGMACGHLGDVTGGVKPVPVL